MATTKLTESEENLDEIGGEKHQLLAKRFDEPHAGAGMTSFVSRLLRHSVTQFLHN